MKLSCSKKQRRGKISEVEQNDVTNDIIDQKQDMVSKEYFPKVSSGHVEQLYLL